MRILVENCCYDLLNIGDVAMLQVAVERLHQLWPNAVIQVVTNSPNLLSRYCLTAEPISAIGRCMWLQDRNIPGALMRIVPDFMSGHLLHLAHRLKLDWPRLTQQILKIKAGIRKRNIDEMGQFIDALYGCDLLVVSGGGDINDYFLNEALSLLAILETAKKWAIPTVMFSQGIGPISNAPLWARAKKVLPNIDIIAVREPKTSPALLKSLGVNDDEIYVTGDDAIEPAYQQRRKKIGSSIGINFRISSYSQISEKTFQALRFAIHKFAAGHQAKLTPLPISFYPHESDKISIQKVLDGCAQNSVSDYSIDDPSEIIKKVGDCRIVITAAYHSAVFALAQGVSAVALAKSQYYKDKFLGLAEQFGAGCEVVMLDGPKFADRFATAAESLWESAEKIKPELINAAARQIASGRNAYQAVYDLIDFKKQSIKKKVVV